MGAPDTPWWHTFFDATYADRNLVEHQAEEADRAAAFIVERLDLAPGAVLLDQCCGIGRISLPLARRGVEVLGVDITPAYVERATAAAAAEDLPCRFECADAFEYVAPAPCDAAINWFTSFGYAPDDRQNLRMLQRVHDSLETGGRFRRDRTARLARRRSVRADEPAAHRAGEEGVGGATPRLRDCGVPRHPRSRPRHDGTHQRPERSPRLPTRRRHTTMQTVGSSRPAL
jgi:SAM-dependent methyltransferase